MSESKGNLIENEDKYIKYRITTYKGQSGSPIFLRVKKMISRDGNGEIEHKHQYVYHFIGLHSRRGPSNDENNGGLKGKSFLETECGDLNFNSQSPVMNNEGKIETKSSTNTVVQMQSDLVKIHGVCDYNIALSIIGSSTKKIINSVKELNLLNSSLLNNNKLYIPSKLNTNFILVKLIMNEEEKLIGLFNKKTSLELIFSLCSKILNIPKEHILIKELSNVDTSSAELIQNYNFDNNKLLGDLVESDNTPLLIYEVMLNFKKYGELLAKKIFDKFLENYDLELEHLQKDFIKKYSKKLFQAIFAEINSFKNFT